MFRKAATSTDIYLDFFFPYLSVETEEIETAVDETMEDWTGLYSLFKEKGDRAVDILYHADPEDFHIPEPGEVYENIEDKDLLPKAMPQGEFESIVNFLSRAEILPTWNSSAPFRILMEKVDENDLAAAWEYASGEQYNFPENSEPVESANSVPEYLRS